MLSLQTCLLLLWLLSLSSSCCFLTSSMLSEHWHCHIASAGMLTHAVPIESQFKSLLPDNLNAELVLGTVTNVKEAVAWLTYTYLHVRMSKNPLVYAITYEQLLVSMTGCFTLTVAYSPRCPIL